MLPRIYAVRTDSPLDEATFQFFINFVQPEKRERILRQGKKQDADNMLIGEILMRLAVKKAFGIDAENHLAVTEHGKPFLKGCENVHFNISHSGSYVVCAVARTPVGVDIQKIGEYKRTVAERVFNEPELLQIEASEDKASEFTKLWTEKEAVLKMLGTGLASGNIKNCLKNYSAEVQSLGDYWLALSVEQK